ncbi:DNA (Cytosine-5)-methyltransferase PliMCI [Gryllus bimaculatus]|nr:DNA (Cytosine-5)-methyltransferase PliMCI [Gryllus bimaculatus]
MPSILCTESFPSEVKERLQELENDFKEGDLTKKGYCKKTWKLVEPHVSSAVAEKVHALQIKFANFDLSESDYCEQLIATLKSSNITGTISVKSKGVNDTEDKKCVEGNGNGSLVSFCGSNANTPKQEKDPGEISEEQRSPSKCNNNNNNGNDLPDAHHSEPGSSGHGASGSARKSASKKFRSNFGASKKRQTDLVSLFENPKRKSHDNNDKEIISPDIDENENCNHVTKKIKIESYESEDNVKPRQSNDKMEKEGSDDDNKIQLKTGIKKQKVVPQRCQICRQLLDDPDLKLYPGHPDGALEEFVALTDPRLSLFTGDEQNLEEGDERPQNKLTHFSIYDKEGHLCPFDNGLIEQNVFLYFSGYMKAIYEESSDIEGGIPTKDLGPINEWWVSGFDGGEHALVGFSTAYGEYYLMEPSEEYAPFMEAVIEKIFLSKLVIEFLVHEVNPSYEDLLNKLQTAVPPKGITSLSEDTLLRHAQFVCDQVLSFDSCALAHEDLLITSPCMRALVKLSGVTIGKRLAMRRAERKDFKISKPAWTKATTTDLVQQNFESYFAGQLDVDSDNKGPRRQRCGVCEACQHPDCGTCVACSDMIKFGGTGRAKQACVKRRCPNMAIAEAEDDDLDDETNVPANNDVEEQKVFSIFKKFRMRVGKDKISWIGSSTSDAAKIYYTEGDYVMIEPPETGTPFNIARIEFMFEDKKGNKNFHGQLFCRATDSILGETADPQELFLVDVCENFPIGSIAHKASVRFRETPENWHNVGGEKIENDLNLPDDGKSFYYHKWYDPRTVRFEDPKEAAGNKKKQFCGTCWKQVNARRFKTPILGERISDQINDEYMGKEFCPGLSVYLQPNAFSFKSTHGAVALKSARGKEEKAKDEDMYPEYYRKSDGPVKGSNEETPKPFSIGYVVAVVAKGGHEFPMPNDIYLRVKKFYRPEDTHKGASLSYQADLNMLYWSDEEVDIILPDVVGTCYVVYGENIDEPIIEWTKRGPNRFYFNQAYNSMKQSFGEPPVQASLLGSQGKGKGKGKGKGRKSELGEKKTILGPEEWPTLSKKLKTLDVFAGCGGLSEGLHQAGLAETRWAIEKEESAANAFKLNNPECTVFTDDCNMLLKLVLNGEKTNEKGQTLPKKGDVDLLCGGPPCQGFSVGLELHYLDKKCWPHPQTICSVHAMAWHFGNKPVVGYINCRLIIIAAAPGLKLPKYPEPTHVFSLRASQLSCMIDDKKYVSNCQWLESAPYRTITVRDAMSDLPEIRNGHRKDEMSYGGEPMSCFQRVMRGNQYQPILRDHICKDMAPLVEARMAHIPTVSGSDWRDLPNIAVRLSDGTFSKKLQYTHHDKKNGKSSTGALRGVCICATGSGKACDPMDRQYNTLIPWCLPHTGNRHNHWAGLYGRLEWDGFFSTTVTNPEPMGKQGRVLHPEQIRVVSVRECARSQGFPDTYRFFGNILDKHRQVGNAVPPPMGAAIGYEIRKSYCDSLCNV